MIQADSREISVWKAQNGGAEVGELYILKGEDTMKILKLANQICIRF